MPEFKKRLRYRCFPVNFAKFLKNTFCYRAPLVATSECDQKLTIKTRNDVIDIILFYTFFLCFCCLLWTGGCFLGPVAGLLFKWSWVLGVLVSFSSVFMCFSAGCFNVKYLFKVISESTGLIYWICAKSTVTTLELHPCFHFGVSTVNSD